MSTIATKGLLIGAVIPGAPHGHCTTHKDVINKELLAFLEA